VIPFRSETLWERVPFAHMNSTRTYRDEIQRRARPVRWIGIGIAVAVVVFVAVLRSSGGQLPRDIVQMAGLGFVVVLVMARLANRELRRRVLCPKCKGSLGYFTSALQDSKQGKRIKFCPHCAVDLDDPMPVAATPAEEVTTPDKLVWK
jgi:hypothetical protein